MGRIYTLLTGLLLLISCVVSASAAPAESAVEQRRYPGTVDLRWSMQYDHPGVDCLVRVHYPQGLSPAVDAAVAKAAKDVFDGNRAQLVEPLAEIAEETRIALSAKPVDGALDQAAHLTARGTAFSVTTYALYRPSGQYASLLYSTSEYTGGAHGMLSQTAVIFDLTSGDRLKLEDLFTDPDRAMKGLAPLVADAIRKQKKEREDTEYDRQTLDLRIERMLLTEQGMTVVYDPYEVGTYSEGSFLLPIPKQALLDLGAHAQLWRQ